DNHARVSRHAATTSARGCVYAMNDSEIRQTPGTLAGIVADANAMGFNMASEPKVGALLAALAAAKPGGRLLELGTGTGHGTAWLLSGMEGGERPSPAAAGGKAT